MLKIKKITFSFLVLLAIIFAFYSSNVKAAETRFPDLKTSRNEILYLADKGIINGYANGKFGPNDSIKRVHAVQMIIRELGVKTGDAPNPNFTDVKTGSYGYAEIAKAKQLGIISGKGKGKFDPNGTLTRGEMAKILVEAYKLKSNTGPKYKDVSSNYFSSTHVQTLAAHNITSGYPDGTFRPNAKLTREHFSLMMARLLNDQFRNYSNFVKGSLSTSQMNLFTQSVVMIHLLDKDGKPTIQGSGFITSNNLIATTFEKIVDNVEISGAEVIVEKTGERYLIEGVVDYDIDFDVALLKPVKKIGLPPLPLAPFSSIKISDRIVTIGMFDYEARRYAFGDVTDLIEEEDPEIGVFKIIENTQENKGSFFGSDLVGGPILNSKGFVIGINSFAMDGSFYAVSSDYLAEMLEPYRHMKFSEIEVESISDMPQIEYEVE